MARKGERLTQEQREQLSQIAIQRHERDLAQRKGAPEYKRCNKCGERKPLSEFYKFKRKLVSGSTSLYPQSRCKRCDIEIRKRNWGRLKAKGVDVAALKRRYEANEDPEKRRRRWRENHAIWRRKQGMRVLGPRRAFEDKDSNVPIKPIATWLREEATSKGREISERSLAEQTGIWERQIGIILREEQAMVRLSTVDRILVSLDAPHMLHELYPEENA